MLVIPAIDLIGGKCVRLTRGDYSEVKEYSIDPVEVASDFVKRGFSFLHVIDLEGAKKGRPVNIDVVKAISEKVDAQVGGGVRTYGDARLLLDSGVKRVIIGTSALKNPRLVKDLIDEFGSYRIVVSIDVKDKEIMVNGWRKNSGLKLDNVLRDFKKIGLEFLIFTDIERDGMLKGINPDSIKKVLGYGFKIIVAGGVSSEKDLGLLREMGVYGCIVGKAFYEGLIDLKNEGATLAKRIVPCMDIKNGRVVKGVNFVDLKDAGDPVELGRVYSEMGADELIFLDIMATYENRGTLYDLVRRISENVNIPFTVGGGVKSLDDIRMLLKNGADKVSIGSYAVANPDFVRDAASNFGSQCIVISLDPKKISDVWKIFTRGGRDQTEVDAVEFAKLMEACGAGELLVNSLDRDGMKNGYDLELLQAITGAVNIPVIASSGAGCMEDFLEVFRVTDVDAALAASLFHYGEIKIPELKKYLSNNGLTIRS